MVLRWIAGIFLAVVGLLLLVQLLILLPPVQSKLKNIVVGAIEEEFDAKASIAYFRLGFPLKLRVGDILLTENEQDTLAFVGEFSINAAILPLVQKKIVVRTLSLESVQGDVGKLMAMTSSSEEDPDPKYETGSEVAAERDEDKSPWTFVVRNIDLNSLDLEIRDEEIGIDLLMKVGQIHVGLGDIDLDSLIHVRAISISQTDVSIQMFEAPVSEEDTSSFSFANIIVDEFLLDMVGFTLIDSVSGMFLNTQAGSLSATGNFVDISHSSIDVDQVDLEDAFCDLVFFPEAENSVELDTPGSGEDLNWGQYLWRITGKRVGLERCSYSMNYPGEPVIANHFDPLHMHILNASGEISDFVLDTDTLIARINNLQAIEKNGFEVLQLDADISRHDSTVSIPSLSIETPNTQLSLELETTVNLTNYNEINQKSFDLNLDISSTNWKDADYFYPFLEKQLWLTDSFGKGSFELDASLSGSLHNLDIRSLYIQMLDSTRIAVHGNVRNGADLETRVIQLNIEEVLSTRSDIQQSFITGIPDSVFTLPSFLFLSGEYSGGADSHQFTGNVKSANGSIEIPYAFANTGDHPDYQLTMMADLHHLESLMDLDLDQVAFTLESNAAGQDLSGLTGNLIMKIDSLTYRSFTYRDLLLNGEIDKGEFATAFTSAMPDFLVSLKAQGTLKEDDLDAELSVLTDQIDLRSLQFTDEDITMKVDADLSLGVHSENAYDLSLNLHQLDLSHEDSLYKVHPVDLIFSTSENNTDFSLKSHFYNLVFKANDFVLDVADDFLHLPGYYLADQSIDTLKFHLPDFQISGSLEYPKGFTHLFFPEVPEFDKLVVSGAYSKKTDALGISISVPRITSGSIQADSLYLKVNGSSEELDVEGATGINVEDLLSGRIKFNGGFRNSHLLARVSYEDSFLDKYLDVAMQIDTVEGRLHFHLIPPELTFNYDQWGLHPDNKASINADSIIFEHFELTNGNEKIVLFNSPTGGGNRMELKLFNFGLSSFQQLFAMDTILNGFANADVLFTDPMGEFAVSGNLNIRDLQVFDYNAGQLKVDHFYYESDSVMVQLAVDGSNQELALEGSWNGSDSLSPLDADLKINSLNLAELNYFLEETVNGAKGKLESDIHIAGNLSDPLFNGFISFANAGVGINFLNNYFSLGTESISINNNVVEFSDFGIVNNKQQAARIDGTVNLGDFSRAYSDLLIRTDNMEIINSTQQQNDLLFGLLKAQSNIRLKGETDAIRVNANVTVDRTTDITYIFPDHLALDNNEGVVHFGKYEPVLPQDEDLTISRSFFGMPSFDHVITKIEIDPGARFNLFFDPVGNNYLDAALSGTINYSMIEDNTEVSGMFEVEEGTLRYSIPLVTVEEYTIESGSFITLSNDLYNPYINIVASSRVRASTEGLMASDPKVMVFKVLLYMTGELNDLKLHFDIDRETNDALVSARLAQLSEKERNVNAINLLVRGSFVFSLQGDEIGGTSTMDAQIDKFYTTHLNHLISENVGFVDLRFDVQSFRDLNTQGEAVMQRNYYYNVGKSFFKDRARVSYKGNMGLATDFQNEQVNSSFVQNELEVEVKITRDGFLRGVFFRKNQYEGLLEGEVIETGGGLRLRKDYYSLDDIFINDKRRAKKEAKKNPEQNEK